MDIEKVEDDLIAELQAQITTTGVKFKSFPDDPEKYLKRFAGVVDVLLRFDGDNFEDPDQEALKKKKFNQKRTADWVLSFITRGLRTHTGAYSVIKAVRQVLTEYTVGTRTGGATATGLKWSSMLWPVSTKFMSQENGKWVHEARFRHEIEETKDN